jgi:hypothetical protein
MRLSKTLRIVSLINNDNIRRLFSVMTYHESEATYILVVMLCVSIQEISREVMEKGSFIQLFLELI